jgi:hypothetical protein
MGCTIESLKESMPGQTEEWYQRILKAFVAVAEPQSSVYSYGKAELSVEHRRDVIRSATKQTQTRTEKAHSTPWLPQVIKVSVDGKLLNLCLGDRKLAERLLFNQISNNPERSQQWALEKTIWDLERDRY